MSDDVLELPADFDPARWPFCEERARAAAALSSFPPPAGRSQVLRLERAPRPDRVAIAQRLRAAQRAGATS